MADIGTDHGFLPVALWEQGVCPKVILADVNQGPLDKAKSNAAESHPDANFDYRLGDGLQVIQPGEVDVIVIAGMGGILISEILTAAPWVKNEKYKLILQPQSHDEVLRAWLWDNGFEICEEASCFDDGKSYICMSAIYTGLSTAHSEAEALLGGFAGKNDEASKAFVERKLRRVRVRLEALESSDAANTEIAVLKKIIDEVT